MALRTPRYEAGIFFVRVYISEHYPAYPLMIKFLTETYHPNVDERGRVNIINNTNWCPFITISMALLTLSGLLSSPDPQYYLRRDVAAQYEDDPENFNEIAVAYTTQYATGDQPLVDSLVGDYFWWDSMQAKALKENDPKHLVGTDNSLEADSSQTGTS